MPPVCYPSAAKQSIKSESSQPYLDITKMYEMMFLYSRSFVNKINIFFTWINIIFTEHDIKI